MFVDEVIKRLIDRFRHIFFLRRMTNPYLLVTQINESLVDQERWENLVHEVETSQQPVFIHIHLMVTHGDRFRPIRQKFSAGQSIADQESWSIDFYDDSILEFDKNVGSLVDRLAATGLLDRTLLIIGSDHGMQWDPLQRLPLILRFPHGQYAGRIQANVQNLDIAATVLDYLGLETPGWMAGQSLIAGSLDQRPIFSTMTSDREENPEGGFKVNRDLVTPPFYQFKGITLVYCEKWYELKLITLEWQTGNVAGSTAACSPGQQITGRQAFEWIVEHLKQNGFDVSTLEDLSPVE